MFVCGEQEVFRTATQITYSNFIHFIKYPIVILKGGQTVMKDRGSWHYKILLNGSYDFLLKHIFLETKAYAQSLETHELLSIHHFLASSPSFPLTRAWSGTFSLP